MSSSNISRDSFEWADRMSACGEVIIEEAQLTRLEELLLHLRDRLTYYHEAVPLEEIEQAVRAVRRSVRS